MRQVSQKCIIVLLGLILGGCGQQTGAYLEVADTSTEQLPQVTEELADVTQTQEPILIYICGEVINPGVYELTGGMRICDAVEAAGGLTDAASREYWNLAEPLTDGEMLYFPTVEEAKERQKTSEETSSADDGRININTADVTELQQIPGIGESRAAAILAYRRDHGDFSSIEDIMQVSGIKNALFEKMKDYITIR